MIRFLSGSSGRRAGRSLGSTGATSFFSSSARRLFSGSGRFLRTAGRVGAGSTFFASCARESGRVAGVTCGKVRSACGSGTHPRPIDQAMKRQKTRHPHPEQLQAFRLAIGFLPNNPGDACRRGLWIMWSMIFRSVVRSAIGLEFFGDPAGASPEAGEQSGRTKQGDQIVRDSVKERHLTPVWWTSNRNPPFFPPSLHGTGAPHSTGPPPPDQLA